MNEGDTVWEISLQILFNGKNIGKDMRYLSGQWPGKTFSRRNIFNYSHVECSGKNIHSRYALYSRGRKSFIFQNGKEQWLQPRAAEFLFYNYEYHTFDMEFRDLHSNEFHVTGKKTVKLSL